MVNPKVVLVCDLDDSLINTKKHKRDLFVLAKRLGAKHIEETYKKVKAKKLFNIGDFARALFRNPSEIRHYIVEAKKLLEIPRAYNYEGSHFFCRELKKKYVLVLLSHGHPSYQRAKFEQSGLAKYFSKVVVTSERSKKKVLSRLKKQHGEVIVVDDSKEIIESARALGIEVHKLKRGRKSFLYHQRVLKKLL
ncbi:MAG: HAD family hydrolase [Patescibacteria group bacterium]|jgi:FMN phosphatase YigB (HAD superfamily)